jgi:HAD superfamily hydrolase (TIGR01509 family)
MSSCRAIIFDMDGVIVDSEPRHESAFLEVVREIGHGDQLKLDFADYVGRSDHELWLDFIAKHQPRQSLEELLEMKRGRILAIIEREEPLYEGLPALVETLAGRYVLGVASGSDRIVVEAVLALKSLRRFFRAVVTASEVAKGKPEPDIFLRTASLLGVAPQECWVIEDSKPGISAGLAAGMRVIAITNTHPAEELSRAHHVVKTYGELERLLVSAPAG